MRAYLSVASVIVSAAFTALGNGMMATFVPVRLNAEGVGPDGVGTVVTAYALGMLLGCVFSGRVVRRVGHIRAFTAFAAAGTISALLMQAWIAVPAWTLLRVLGGFCTTAMFMAAQSWLNEVTGSSHRGRVMALFYLGYTVSLGLGALIMNRVPAAAPTPFLLLAGLYAAAAIPIALTRLETPPAPERIAVRPREVYRISPVGLVGAFGSGALGMTMLGVGAMYGTAVGLSEKTIALAIAALQGGNLVIQWPLGALSDRVDRRYVIAGAGLAVVAVSLALLALGAANLAAMILLFGLWGGLAESIYAVSAAHANDRAEPGSYVMLSGTILVVWATGSTLGPVLATAAMRAFGPSGLWLYFIAVAGGFSLFVIWRQLQRERPSAAEQEEFVTRAASAAPIAEWSAPEGEAERGGEEGRM